LKTSAALVLGSIFAGRAGKFNAAENLQITLNAEGQYVLPSPDYSYDALESYTDRETMELHHSKHHNGYVNGLNKATAMIREAIENNDFLW